MNDFFNRLNIDSYPDVIAVVCIPLILMILGIAFPLLSSSANKIQNKYKSRSIAKSFDKEKTNILFKNSLYVSLFATVIWLLQIPAPNVKNPYLLAVLENSALIFLLISTVVLVLSMFGYIRLLKNYHNPDILLKKLVEIKVKRLSKRWCSIKHSINRKLNSYLTKLLNALNRGIEDKVQSEYSEKQITQVSELFYLSIKEDDDTVSRAVKTHLDEQFKQFKQQNHKDENKSIVYHSAYYSLIYNSTILISQQEKKLSSIFNSPIMLEYLVTDIIDYRLSEESYTVIWNSLLQCLFYDNQTMVFSYWQTAHSLMPRNQFSLNVIYEEINKSDKDVVKAIDRYSEFHHVLGALLLFKEKYNLLSKCIRYTQSRPASYYLVPGSLGELVDSYCKLKVGYLDGIMYYAVKHPFPDLVNGVDLNDYIVMWINRYFGLLFLRQYQAKEEYTINFGYDSWGDLDAKNKLNELAYLKERMEVLKHNAEYYLKNEDRDILKELGLDIFEKGEEGKYKPVIELDDYIGKIKTKYDLIKREQRIEPDILKEFNRQTKEIINHAIDSISGVLNASVIPREETTNPDRPFYISVFKNHILPKGAFATDQDIGYSNTISIVSKASMSEMEHYFTLSFGRAVRKSYAVYQESLIDALDRLELNESHIVVNINVNLAWKPLAGNDKARLRLDNGTNTFIFKNKNNEEIEIVYLPSVSYESINNSLIVLKRTDLPSLIKHDIGDNLIQKYKLEEIDEKNKVYASVIDLNEDKELKSEIEKSYKGNDKLEESVFAVVATNYELRWKKDVRAIQIQIYSAYERKGDISNVEDIKPI